MRLFSFYKKERGSGYKAKHEQEEKETHGSRCSSYTVLSGSDAYIVGLLNMRRPQNVLYPWPFISGLR